MSTTELIDLIEALPADKKGEVEKLVFELIQKSATKKPQMMFGDLKGLLTFKDDGFDNADMLSDGRKSKREFGGGKDIFGEITDDFNDPLDELKDYM